MRVCDVSSFFNLRCLVNKLRVTGIGNFDTTSFILVAISIDLNKEGGLNLTARVFVFVCNEYSPYYALISFLLFFEKFTNKKNKKLTYHTYLMLPQQIVNILVCAIILNEILILI